MKFTGLQVPITYKQVLNAPSALIMPIPVANDCAAADSLKSCHDRKHTLCTLTRYPVGTSGVMDRTFTHTHQQQQGVSISVVLKPAAGAAPPAESDSAAEPRTPC